MHHSAPNQLMAWINADLLLTHCGLVTPYGIIELDHHIYIARQHQAITPTNADLSSLTSNGIRQRTISQDTPQPSITKISLKITYLELYLDLSGASKLIGCMGTNFSEI